MRAMQVMRGTSGPRRILIVHASVRHPPGGAEQYVVRLAGSLKERGHEVRVATARVDGEALRELEGIDVSVLPVRNVYTPGRSKPPKSARAVWHALDVFNPSVFPWMRRTIAEFRPDVVHTHNFQGLSGAAFGALRGIGHVHTVHDYSLVDPRTTLLDDEGSVRANLTGPRRIRARVLRGLLDADTVIFPSRRALEVHRSLGWRAGGRAEVLSHGWTLPGPRPRRPRRRDGPLRFLFLGMLTASKGVDTLLEAWGADGVADAELWVAGDGPLRANVETAAASSPSIRFLGWAAGEDKAGLLAKSDVLVFPSRWPEVFPLSVAEAYLSGLPVMASRVAHPPPLRDGENGIVVDGGRGAWRRAMARLAEDPSLLDGFRPGVRSTARELDWDRHVDRLDDLYAGVLR